MTGPGRPSTKTSPLASSAGASYPLHMRRALRNAAPVTVYEYAFRADRDVSFPRAPEWNSEARARPTGSRASPKESPAIYIVSFGRDEISPPPPPSSFFPARLRRFINNSLNPTRARADRYVLRYDRREQLTRNRYCLLSENGRRPTQLRSDRSGSSSVCWNSFPRALQGRVNVTLKKLVRCREERRNISIRNTRCSNVAMLKKKKGDSSLIRI